MTGRRGETSERSPMSISLDTSPWQRDLISALRRSSIVVRPDAADGRVGRRCSGVCCSPAQAGSNRCSQSSATAWERITDRWRQWGNANGPMTSVGQRQGYARHTPTEAEMSRFLVQAVAESHLQVTLHNIYESDWQATGWVKRYNVSWTFETQSQVHWFI